MEILFYSNFIGVEGAVVILTSDESAVGLIEDKNKATYLFLIET